MLRNFLLTAISLIITIFFIEFIIENLWIKNVSFFKNKNDYETYKKYHYKLHHLKEPRFDERRDFKYKENLLFATLNNEFLNKSKKIILINGDSWAESILEKNKYREEINLLFSNLGKKFNSTILNSGATSYSLSPITLQLDILRKDYKINPNIIITIIDHTDFGDELCRYKNRINLDNNNIISIKAEKLNIKEAYNLEFNFKIHDILYSNNFNIIKLLKVKKLDKEFNKKYYNYNGKARCGWNKIISPLINGLKANEVEYLTNITNRYLEKAFENKKLKYLYLVIHPHRDHILNKYNYYYDSLIYDIINKSRFKNKIKIINFKKIFKKTYVTENKQMTINSIFIQSDVASHLTEKANFLFYKKIFENL